MSLPPIEFVYTACVCNTVLPDGTGSSEHSNLAVPVGVIKEIMDWEKQGETTLVISMHHTHKGLINVNKNAHIISKSSFIVYTPNHFTTELEVH